MACKSRPGILHIAVPGFIGIGFLRGQQLPSHGRRILSGTLDLLRARRCTPRVVVRDEFSLAARPRAMEFLSTCAVTSYGVARDHAAGITTFRLSSPLPHVSVWPSAQRGVVLTRQLTQRLVSHGLAVERLRAWSRLRGHQYTTPELSGTTAVSLASISRFALPARRVRDIIYGFFNFIQASLANRSVYMQVSPSCHHGCGCRHTQSHILSACSALSGLYGIRHDKLVRTVAGAFTQR